MNKHLPGHEALWFVIGGYQLAFSIFFAIYAGYKVENRAAYAQYQNILSHELGLVNTIVLLSSSWFAVAAIKLSRSHARHSMQRAQHYLWAAVLCGAVFSAIKFVEYQKSITAGYTLYTHEFFTFYYLLTGLHLMHVWVGMCGLMIAISLLRKNTMTEEDELTSESCVVFWHMVDYLWVMIFPILYLIR